MPRILTKLALFLLITSSSLCNAAEPTQIIKCDKANAKAIDAISKAYFEEHSNFSSKDVNISSQLCLNDNASAKLKLISNPDTDAIVYLHKVNNQWQVVLFGSAFTENNLEQIPKALREATGGMQVWKGWSNHA